MADEPASVDAIHRVAAAFDQESVVHAFIGGAALAAWGIPRATFDLDLAVSIPPKGLTAALEGLSRRGFVVEQSFRKGFKDRVAGMETVHVHLPAGRTLMAVDLFLATTPFLESVLERRKSIDLGRGTIHVCSAADLILLKLVADRPKDRVDVQNVLSVQGVPEREYLTEWSEKLGVADRLRSAISSSP